MNKNSPLVLSIIGKSDSGKTRLILKLLPELKTKGYKVAVAKHCPHGFNLDIEGKDSFRFTQAGAEGTFLSSDGEIALIRPRQDLSIINEKLKDYFSDFDIVLMEGYSNEPGINKIQIIRSSVGKEVISTSEIIAYISDMPVDADRPIFKPDDIKRLISFIQTLKQRGRV